MKNLVAVSIASTLLFASCQSNSTSHQPKQEQATVSSIPAVQLNEGKKWQANEATTTGIVHMQTRVKEFSTPDEVAAYHQLRLVLEEEFQMIFKKCTMKGEAHNQLHNYLLPLKRRMNLLKSTDVNELKHHLKDLDEYLKSYSNYFE